MPRTLSSLLDDKWNSVQRFVALGEGYGAARELSDLAELTAKLSNDEKQAWSQKMDSIYLSPECVNQAIGRGLSEIAYARRLIADVEDLIDDEVILMLSKLMSLRSVERYLHRKGNVSWSTELAALWKEVDRLRESGNVGAAIRRCEATIRRNTDIRLA